MRQQLGLVPRRLLEIVLVALLAASGLALLRGRGTASTLGAAVPAIIAVVVTLDRLGRGRVKHCSSPADR
jgi:hypothetical protein